jgi:hypothetical protein
VRNPIGDIQQYRIFSRVRHESTNGVEGPFEINLHARPPVVQISRQEVGDLGCELSVAYKDVDFSELGLELAECGGDLRHVEDLGDGVRDFR